MVTRLVAAVLVALAWLTAPGVAAEPPSRIVSTSPSITETLFALGLGPRIVGVSSFCRFPAEVARLPKVGSFLKPDTELIARLHPDLVIVHMGPNDVPRQLSALGMTAVTVDRGTLAGVFSSIRTIGTAAGVSDRAEALVARLQQRLDAVRRRHGSLDGSGRGGSSDRPGRGGSSDGSRRGGSSDPPSPAKKVLVIMGRQPGTLSDLIAVGRGSYLNDLVTVAGGINVLDDPGLPDYPRISMETVIRLAPDLIVDAGDMGDTVEEHIRRQPATERLWQQQANVRAVERKAVHAVTSDAFVVPGPRVVEAAETLARWLDALGK